MSNSSLKPELHKIGISSGKPHELAGSFAERSAGGGSLRPTPFHYRCQLLIAVGKKVVQLISPLPLTAVATPNWRQVCSQRFYY